MNWLVNGALVMSILSLLLISKTYALPLVLVAAALKALGQGVGQVVLQGEALKRADPGSLGIATGTIFMGNDLGNTLGPVIGGAVTNSLGYSAMFYVGIAAFALAMAAFIVYQKRRRRKIGMTPSAFLSQSPLRIGMRKDKTMTAIPFRFAGRSSVRRSFIRSSGACCCPNTAIPSRPRKTSAACLLRSDFLWAPRNRSNSSGWI